jgi:ubiquinone/menaquinone biosynthesis C-methylase UbiE
MQRVLEPEVMDTEEEATEYDAMDHSAANQSVVDRFVALGGLRGRILDIGTGPAHLPILLAERAAHTVPNQELRLLAVDAAGHMLAIGRRHLQRANHLAHRIHLVLGNAKHLPVPTSSFVGVYSNTIMHHLPEPVPYLAEARRVLEPGGVLLIRDLIRPATEQDAMALVELHAAGATTRARRLFFDSFRASFTLPEVRAMADRAGLARARLWQSSDRHFTLEIGAGGSIDTAR